MVVDDTGNLYCSGTTAGSVGETNGGGRDAFVVKLNSSGEFQWSRQLGKQTTSFAGADHSKDDLLLGIALDSSGNVFANGNTTGAIGERHSVTQSKAPPLDVFVMKLNDQGQLLWVTQLGATTKWLPGSDNTKTDRCFDIAVDPQGNGVCAGDTLGALGDLAPHEGNPMIVKLTPSGSLRWLRQLGGNTLGPNHANPSSSCPGVATDRFGNVFCAGSPNGVMGGPHGGKLDAFIAKLTARGDLSWIFQLSPNQQVMKQSDHSGFDTCRSVAVDRQGNVYCGGFTSGSLRDKNGGQWDAFVLKLSPDGAFSPESQ